MARRKSINDIIAQRDRILSKMGFGAIPAEQQGYRYSFNRANRVINTASEYWRNITNMRSIRNATTTDPNTGLRVESERARNQKVSSNTYRGLSKG